MSKSVGRPSVTKSPEIQEQRVRIWIDHFYNKLPVWELTEKHGVSKSTIEKAITWVNNNFIRVPNKSLLRGAIFAIEERIKKITALLEKEFEEKEPSNRNIVELNREIREDSRDVLKLRSLYEEKYSVELKADSSIKEILKALGETKK